MTPTTAVLLTVISVMLTTVAVLLDWPWVVVLFAALSLYMSGECLAIGHREIAERRKKEKGRA